MSVERAAAAVHAAMPDPSVFPRAGVIKRVTVTKSATDPAGVLIEDLAVDLDGDVYGCGFTGAFAAEAFAATSPDFVGRAVKVELIGGSMFVAYTLNGGQ